MKILATLLATGLIAISSISYGKSPQTVSANEVDQIFKALSKGDWKEVEQLSGKIINRDSPAQHNLIGRFRYIYLLSLLKRIESKSISARELEKRLLPLQGKNIIQPWHPINSKGGRCFNQICVSGENKAVIYTAQTNSKGTLIYSFEYFDVGYPLDISTYDGQNGRMGGVLRKIDINKNLGPALKVGADVSWVIRMHIENAFMQYER